jgi:predicted HTH transcriptional regulator
MEIRNAYIYEKTDRNILVDSEDTVRIDSLKAEKKYDLQVNKSYSMTDITLDKLASYFKNNYLRTDKEELLRLNLIGQEANKIYPTNALLAITGCLNNAKIRCSYCASECQEIILDSILCEGNMMMQIMAVEEFLELYMPVQKKPIMRHTIIRHLTRRSNQRSLAKRVMHRDYSLCDDIIEVKLSDKALKIFPGKFPLEITRHDVQKGYSFAEIPICKNMQRITHD